MESAELLRNRKHPVPKGGLEEQNLAIENAKVLESDGIQCLPVGPPLVIVLWPTVCPKGGAPSLFAVQPWVAEPHL